MKSSFPARSTHGVLWLFCCAVLVELCAVAAMVPFGDFTQQGIPSRFVLAGLIAGSGYLVAVFCFGVVSPRGRKALFWGLALLLRIVIFPIAPADDIWRYIWEGMIQLDGHNPYLLAPDAIELVALRPDWWGQINHSDWTTIYPPGAQGLFALLARISPSVWLFKLVFAIADLFTVYFVLRLHIGSSRYRDAAWYAWNPLVVYSFAGGGHFDSVMIALMTAAIWALYRANPLGKPSHAPQWVLLSGVLLGAAISVKVIPVLCVPLLILGLGRRAVALLPGLTLPLLTALWYNFPTVNVFASLGKFADVARSNDLVWWVFDAMGMVHTAWINPFANLLIVIATCIVSVVFARNWQRGMLWVFGIALVLSPVAHAWYLTWILPIAAWRRSYPWFVFSVSLFLYFMLWESELFGETWTPTTTYHLAVILPPLLSMIALRWRQQLHSRREHQNI